MQIQDYAIHDFVVDDRPFEVNDLNQMKTRMMDVVRQNAQYHALGIRNAFFVGAWIDQCKKLVEREQAKGNVISCDQFLDSCGVTYKTSYRNKLRNLYLLIKRYPNIRYIHEGIELNFVLDNMKKLRELFEVDYELWTRKVTPDNSAPVLVPTEDGSRRRKFIPYRRQQTPLLLGTAEEATDLVKRLNKKPKPDEEVEPRFERLTNFYQEIPNINYEPISQMSNVNVSQSMEQMSNLRMQNTLTALSSDHLHLLRQQARQNTDNNNIFVPSALPNPAAKTVDDLITFSPTQMDISSPRPPGTDTIENEMFDCTDDIPRLSGCAFLETDAELETDDNRKKAKRVLKQYSDAFITKYKKHEEEFSKFEKGKVPASLYYKFKGIERAVFEHANRCNRNIPWSMEFMSQEIQLLDGLLRKEDKFWENEHRDLIRQRRGLDQDLFIDSYSNKSNNNNNN